MSYNTKEVWIPIDSTLQNLAASATGAAIPVTSGAGAITRGLLCGVFIRTANADTDCDALPIKVFNGAPGTGNLLYSATYNLGVANNGTNVDDSDMLDSPVPFFAQPQIQIGPVQGSVTTTNYTVSLYIKPLA